MSTLTKAGRYELREELGRGSVGVVHRAHDPVIGRDVAVKTLHLSEAGTGMSREELVSRFQTETRAAGLLAHPNIVVVFDAGEAEGLFYITMELVDGRSLQTLLDGRQLFPLPRIIKIMEQVCSALDFAHQHNVVHRDIKPANLMLTGDDTIKITDFGTAKILQFGTAQTAHVMGTPSYMSPEQVKGKPVDGRSDIFSLGVILYEMVTGEKPFPGQNITTVIYKIINEEPIPPQSLDSSIHVGLSNVIKRALSKDPAGRYQTCHEFFQALKNYHDLSDPDVTTRVTSVSSQVRTPSVRTPGPSTKPPATVAGLRYPSPESNVLLIPAVAEKRERGGILLTVILLGVIGFAGYRVWPPMLDLWQRMHQQAAGTSATSLPGSIGPEVPAAKPIASDATPDVKSDATSDLKSDPSSSARPAAIPDLKPNPNTDATPSTLSAVQPAATSAAGGPVSSNAPLAHEDSMPQQSPTAKSGAQPSVPPSADSVQKPAARTQTPVASAPISPANTFKMKLRSQLAGISLAGKVNIQVNGNALGLSGRLTPEEYRKLLNLLHTLPAGVKVIDDIDVGGASGEATAN